MKLYVDGREISTTGLDFGGDEAMVEFLDNHEVKFVPKKDITREKPADE